MPGRRGDDAGRQERQLGVAAAEQRQVAHLALVDHAADVGRLRLQQLGAAGDGHFLGQRADAQLQIDLRAVCTLTRNARRDRALEALQLGGHRVDADAQAGEHELAAVVGHGRRCTPVPSCVAVTVTPGSTAPLSS